MQQQSLITAQPFGTALLATALMAILVLFTASSAQAQSPYMTIKNNAPRMGVMWYPEKVAFRAGLENFYSDSTQWDAANVGNASVAFGAGTRASAPMATAIGIETTANGNHTTAMGHGTTASGNDATAMGNETTASGTAAVAMGTLTTASGGGAVAMGNGTTASGGGTVAMGIGTTASGFTAVAMGDETTAATDQSVSIGQCNSANRGNDDDDSTTGPFFVVGNGDESRDGCQSHSDALVLDKAGNLTISGRLNQRSDRRLKTSIESMEGVLKKLGRIRAVRYQFKNQRTYPSGEQIGLIAQNVQKEFPSLVSRENDSYLSLSYPKFSTVLLKGLQEQQATIDSLKLRVQDLKEVKNRQEKIIDQVAALKASQSESAVAGWRGFALLAILMGFGGFGVGLFWRREE